MRNTASLVLCVLLAGGAFAKDKATKCCFTNTAYTGVCEVTPAQDETCKSILHYLNSSNSAGKSYCGGTSVRGGWAQASCASPKP